MAQADTAHTEREMMTKRNTGAPIARLFSLDGLDICSQAISFECHGGSREPAHAYLRYLLRSTLDHGGIAMHLCRKSLGSSDCLRIVVCVPRWDPGALGADEKNAAGFLISRPFVVDDGDSYVWYETFPAPGILAPVIMDTLAEGTGAVEEYCHSSLLYEYAGSKQKAEVVWNGPVEAMVYFTDIRPISPMSIPET